MPPRSEILRASLFSLYFFLLVGAYYFLKPLSRSLYVTFLGADNLPYVWIATTVLLSLLIPFFQWKVGKVKPKALIITIILSLILLLVVFHSLLETPGMYSAFTFYILVDIYSVLIIENFWSLTNSTYQSELGKRWYGLIASGGMLGGVAAGSLTSWLIDKYHFTPLDLIILSGCIFAGSLPLVWLLFKTGLAQSQNEETVAESASFKDLYAKALTNPYVRWIAYLLFAAQLIEPLVEYQFMSFVEKGFSSLGERTSYVSGIFAYTSIFGVVINIVVLPLLHLVVGVGAGLLLQPVLISLGSLAFIIWQNLTSISILKIIDRGLAYSSGRASRELLYIPFGSTAIYKLKAWVDVYGYRFFRIFGSLLLLLITKWLVHLNPVLTSAILTLVISFVWILFVIKINKAK